jgi:hypothetical protein
MLLVLILLQFRVLSSFAESASGIRVVSSFAESAFYPHLRNPLPESAFYPHLRNPFPQSASAIRIPVPRFIPTRITAEFIQAVVFKTESPFRQTEDM